MVGEGRKSSSVTVRSPASFCRMHEVDDVSDVIESGRAGRLPALTLYDKLTALGLDIDIGRKTTCDHACSCRILEDMP